MAFPDYSIAADFGGSFDAYIFHQEMAATIFISATFEGVRVAADLDTVTTVFDVLPSAGDQLLVDAAVAAYPTGTITARPDARISISTSQVDPGVTDDNTAGYGILTRWLNTVNQTTWVCTDANTGAAVWKRTSNTVNVDNDRIDLYDSLGGQIFTTVAIVVAFNVTRLNTTPSLFTLAGGAVTCNFTGSVKVGYDITIDSGNNRCTSRQVLQQNGAEVPGTRSWGYHRNTSSGENTVSATCEIPVTSGDVLRVTSVRQSGGVDLFTVANGSRFRIERTA